MTEKLIFNDGKIYGYAEDILVWLVSEIGKVATLAMVPTDEDERHRKAYAVTDDLNNYMYLLNHVKDCYADCAFIKVYEDFNGNLKSVELKESDT